MRTIPLSLALMFVAAPVLAQDYPPIQPNSLSMSCAAASGLVSREGFAVIGTGPVKFDRFVSGVEYCGFMQTTVPAWIATADTAQCLVGSRCILRRSND